jgi:serine/threonine-protein kinase
MIDEPKILAGRYEVGDLIGRGGMAEVHIGYDTRLGRTVAIKILRADLARDPSFQTRFRREAQAAAGLNHPTIVAVYDTGEDTIANDAGQVQATPFIVMEYVEGHTVRDILKGDVAAPIDEAVEITAGVLSALDYAHHAGLVHRDIKPANVMLTPTGAVKVMDFGIARALADSGQTMTQTQAVVGTAQYLSPEQARGENVDARSDLYSAGCLLFELLTGRPPFIGDSPVSVAYQHVREEAPLPSAFASDVPAELDAVVARSLRKNREDRYSSAQEFLADMRAAMGEPLTPMGGIAPGAGFGPVGATAAGVGAGAAAAGLGGGTAPVTGATAVMPAAVGAGAAGAPGWATVVGGPAAGGPGQLGAPLPVPSAVAVEDHDLVYDNPKRRRLIQIGILVGAVLAAVLLVWALFAMTRPPETGPDSTMVTIPILENQTEEDAVEKLEELGLEVEVEEEASTEVEAGRVVGTDPDAGEEVEKGSTVTLIVSLGPDEIEIPSVRGMLRADAEDVLERAGLKITQIESAHDPDIDSGRVTATDPPEGTVVAPGTEIILYVSDGQVELPDLRGKQESEARQILVELGLVPNIVVVETDEFAPGEVLTQDPLPGLVAQRSTVTMQVAKERTTVQVPNVVGMTEAEARAALQAVGLSASTSSQSSLTVATGRVISQNPSAGITVAKGTTVAIVLSSGPGPLPGT